MTAFKRISVDEAAQLIEQGDVSVVDIRKPQDFAAGHIQNAQNIDDHNIGEFLTKAEKNRPVICCCYHGISSQNAAAFFIEQGFQEVYSIDGGWEKWRQRHESS